MTGKIILGYTIKQLLGSGGMADVWYAENSLGKPGAVKIMHQKFVDNEAVTSRFLKEAKAMMKFDHANIRQVYDQGEIDGIPFILMEYLSGQSLKEIIGSAEQPSDKVIKEWLLQSMKGLDHAHKKGVIHRDIKPSNLFITDTGQLKILDFGIAKVEGELSDTQTGQGLGTIRYMSPEQVIDPKRIDQSTDLYSLGVSFYQLLSGIVPYADSTHSSYEIQNKIVQEKLDLSILTIEWRYILENLLEKDPNKRTVVVDSAIVEDEETIIDGEKFSYKDKFKYTIAPYKKFILPNVVILALAIIGWIAIPRIQTLSTAPNVEEECDDHRISAIVAHFTDTSIDGFSNTVVTRIDRSLDDSIYNVRTNPFQTRDINRYHDFIRETYFLNTCDTSGIFVNGYRSEKDKIFNFYATLVNLKLNTPEYIKNNSIVIDNPQSIYFDVREDATLIADFIVLLLKSQSVGAQEGIKMTYEFQKLYDLTAESQHRFRESSILGPLYLQRANFYAMEGNDERANQFYEQSIKYGSPDIDSIAQLNKRQVQPIVDVMHEDPELRKLRASNIKEHEKIESGFARFLRGIGKAIEKFFNNLFNKK